MSRLRSPAWCVRDPRSAHLERSIVPFAFALLICFGLPASAQTRITTPQEFFGHRIGADYVLPNYTAYVRFFETLDAESDRMTLVDIGRTEEGRTQYMAIVTSPENHRSLERYREIAERLARAEGITDEDARALAAEGKAVVWIDGGLHADEVLGAQQLMETVYQLVSRNDAETLRILEGVIVLAAHANPDGMELVSDWYMREPDPLRRSTAGLPRLYQKYIGHDNNRDFYASTQRETENINRQLYHVWFPQIVYNHHQSGPSGTVLFAPPFRDPFNYVFDPLVVTGVDLLGAAMHNRFVAEGKPGATMRSGSNYSTWWNGGLRTTAYFHNMIGLLTETIGNPTPIQIPFVAARQLPRGDLPVPIAPQVWHFRQSVDYSVTANYAVLDAAERYRDTFLFNIYRMGRNSIDRGSGDSWTTYPSEIAAVQGAIDSTRDQAAPGAGGSQRAPSGQEGQRLFEMLRTRETRDPRAYVLPSDQPDLPTAVKFVNALRENGITVHRALGPFLAGGKRYPAGSYVIRTAQAFRPHVLDMFEPQDHPHDVQYPGGPPIPPYDVTGWTLAYQMGVSFDRILDPFDADLEELEEWNVEVPPGSVESMANVAGYILSPRYVDGLRVVTSLLRQGERVFRLESRFAAGGRFYEPGSLFVPANRGTREKLVTIASTLGVSFQAAASRPQGMQLELRQPRIALWDEYGGSIASGWTRWILEQNEIPFDVVFPRDIDAGGLHARYDLIVFPDGAIVPGFAGGGSRVDSASVPHELRARLGTMTSSATLPELRAFLAEGGSIVTIGRSTSLASQLGLPVRDKLSVTLGRAPTASEFYVPGSILRARVKAEHPLAYGVGEQVDVFFDNSPVFDLGNPAVTPELTAVAWFETATPLRSGWAWGESALQGGAIVAEARVGPGRLYLFGPNILFRAQSHGTFKFFFNAVAASAANPAAIP